VLDAQSFPEDLLPESPVSLAKWRFPLLKEREEYPPGVLIVFRAKGKECSGTRRWSFYERMSYVAITGPSRRPVRAEDRQRCANKPFSKKANGSQNDLNQMPAASVLPLSL
jgi:hypothetical protein